MVSVGKQDVKYVSFIYPYLSNVMLALCTIHLYNLAYIFLNWSLK